PNAIGSNYLTGEILRPKPAREARFAGVPAATMHGQTDQMWSRRGVGRRMLADVVLAHLPVKGGRPNAEGRGRPVRTIDASVAADERVDDCTPLQLGEGARFLAVRDAGGDGFDPTRVDFEFLAGGHNHRPLDNVLQLADVSWPGVSGERAERVRMHLDV